MILDFINNIDKLNHINTKTVDNLSTLHTHNIFNNTLSVFSLNIRSIRLHFDELTLYLKSHNSNFDIIVLSETWLLCDFKLNLKGYLTINSIGTLNKSDGITILIKENIKINCINSYVLDNCNSLEINFQLYDKQYILVGIYRSPNDNADLFINGLDSYLSNASYCNSKHIIL